MVDFALKCSVKSLIRVTSSVCFCVQHFCIVAYREHYRIQVYWQHFIHLVWFMVWTQKWTENHETDQWKHIHVIPQSINIKTSRITSW